MHKDGDYDDGECNSVATIKGESSHVHSFTHLLIVFIRRRRAAYARLIVAQHFAVEHCNRFIVRCIVNVRCVRVMQAGK